MKVFLVCADREKKIDLAAELQKDIDFAKWKFYTTDIDELYQKESLKEEDDPVTLQKKVFDKFESLLANMKTQDSVCTMSIIDVIAATSWILSNKQELSNEEYNALTAEEFRERQSLSKHKLEFTHIFYLPIDDENVSEFIRAFDNKIRQILVNNTMSFTDLGKDESCYIEKIRKEMGLEEILVPEEID